MLCWMRLSPHTFIPPSGDSGRGRAGQRRAEAYASHLMSSPVAMQADWPESGQFALLQVSVLLVAPCCSGASPSQMHDMRSVAVNATRLAFAGKPADSKPSTACLALTAPNTSLQRSSMGSTPMCAISRHACSPTSQVSVVTGLWCNAAEILHDSLTHSCLQTLLGSGTIAFKRRWRCNRRRTPVPPVQTQLLLLWLRQRCYLAAHSGSTAPRPQRQAAYICFYHVGMHLTALPTGYSASCLPEEHTRGLAAGCSATAYHAHFLFCCWIQPSLQVLSDVVESLIGAVYVDSGGDMEVTWRVTQVGSATPLCLLGWVLTYVDCSMLNQWYVAPGCLQKLLDPMVVPETLPVHPIRKLQVRLCNWIPIPPSLSGCCRHAAF
jgi:hypothetical protein